MSFNIEIQAATWAACCSLPFPTASLRVIKLGHRDISYMLTIVNDPCCAESHWMQPFDMTQLDFVSTTSEQDLPRWATASSQGRRGQRQSEARGIVIPSDSMKPSPGPTTTESGPTGVAPHGPPSHVDTAGHLPGMISPIHMYSKLSFHPPLNEDCLLQWSAPAKRIFATIQYTHVDSRL